MTQSQLLDLFNDENLLFSPWFRIIAQRWMIGGNTNNQVDNERIGGDDGGEEGWWDDLDRTMYTTFVIMILYIDLIHQMNIWVGRGMQVACFEDDMWRDKVRSNYLYKNLDVINSYPSICCQTRSISIHETCKMPFHDD